MQYPTLAELAELVGGTLRGDPDLQICGAAPLADAAAGEITLADHPDRLTDAAASQASAVVCPPGGEASALQRIVVEDVHKAFTSIVQAFRPPRTGPTPGVHPTAVIAETAIVAQDVCIQANVVIGEDVTVGVGSTIYAGAVVMAGCRIGAGVRVFPNATLYEDTVVGDRCIIHAGATIGAHGFGYTQENGCHRPTAQLGCVVLGSDVEVGAGTTIDRGVYGPTRVGDGTKIDNLAQIAHNCQIGRHNLICSQVGIAGSTTTGDYVVMAGQAGVRDHVTIGDRAQLGAMCGVSNDVPAGASVLGAPAVPVRDQRLRFAAIAKLPEMRKEFKQLRKQVAELERRQPNDEPQPGIDGSRAA
ncbi:MAG: UDP-3-O-(3-hydroxymyristoyl)glucosamine N-acyltransferase [Planctomycetota bacterium]